MMIFNPYVIYNLFIYLYFIFIYTYNKGDLHNNIFF